MSVSSTRVSKYHMVLLVSFPGIFSHNDVLSIVSSQIFGADDL